MAAICLQDDGVDWDSFWRKSVQKRRNMMRLWSCFSYFSHTCLRRDASIDMNISIFLWPQRHLSSIVPFLLGHKYVTHSTHWFSWSIWWMIYSSCRSCRFCRCQWLQEKDSAARTWDSRPHNYARRFASCNGANWILRAKEKWNQEIDTHCFGYCGGAADEDVRRRDRA